MPKKTKAEKDAAKAAAKLKKAQRKAGAGGAGGGETKGEDVDTLLSLASISGEEKLTKEQQRVATSRAVTGVLASEPGARDLKFQSFSVMVGGNPLVQDCDLELNFGCRYGLIGQNGCGKSNVLNAIAQRDIPLPDHVDMYHLHEEAPATEQTGVEAVIAHLVEESERLEAISAQIIEDYGADDDRLEAIFERLDELDPQGQEPVARKIMSGLGFRDDLVPMDRKTKHMSGGWRMRVSLAKALFAAPSLLLLDEPTNHLDLEACVWLEDHLATYSKCLFVVSHSQDFLNAVCTHTVWLSKNVLSYYGGNYDTFCRVVAEEERVQVRHWKKQEADMLKLSEFVRVNKANGAAASATSKGRVLDKLKAEAVDKPIVREPTLVFQFKECEKLAPPVLPFDNVSFSYSGEEKDYLYAKLNIGVDYDSRIALVGPNGCGKSTLLKLMSGELNPTEGQIKPHPHLKLGLYHQHSADVLDNDVAPLHFIRSLYPPAVLNIKEEAWRSYLANFGFSTQQQMSPIGMLSDGLKSRLLFAIMAKRDPGVLLLDEPTNHLDIDAVDGLATAINAYQGGVVLVSHDFRLIDQVAKEIWVCEDKSVKRFEGTIHDYKRILSKKMALHKV